MVDTGTTVPNNITVTGSTSSNISFNNGFSGVSSGMITINAGANATIALRDWWNGTVQQGAITGQVTGGGSLSINSGSGTGGALAWQMPQTTTVAARRLIMPRY